MMFNDNSSSDDDAAATANNDAPTFVVDAPLSAPLQKAGAHASSASGSRKKNAEGGEAVKKAPTNSRYIASSYPNFADEKSFNEGGNNIMKCLGCPTHVTAYVECFENRSQRHKYSGRASASSWHQKSDGAAAAKIMSSPDEVVAHYLKHKSDATPSFLAEPQQTKKPKRGVSNNDAGAEYHDYDGDTTNVKVFCVLCPINDDNNASYGISNDGPQIIAAFNESPPNSYACAPLRGGETPWASAALCCITCAASKSSTIYFVCHQCARRVRTALVAAKRFVKICHKITNIF